MLKFFSFYQKIIRKYDNCCLLKNEIASHIAWKNVNEYNIENLHRISWSANSLDFNMIEQAWIYIKRHVEQKTHVVNIISIIKDVWRDVWEKLNQNIIRKWVERMISHMKIVKEQNDDNKYHD